MAEQKTKPTLVVPREFLAGIEPQRRREDALALLGLYSRATKAPAVMWGPAIVGFGRYSYLYRSGHSGEWAAVGFSPRKQNLTLYFTDGFEHYVEQLEGLGAHTTAKSCLYLKRLDGIDLSPSIVGLAEYPQRDLNPCYHLENDPWADFHGW